MRRMLIVAALGLGLVQGWALAQESPRAKKTRESLKKIVLEDLNWKDEMTHVVFSDISRECDKKVTFEIDTNGGMSRNTRLSYKVKKATLEKVLNDLADQNDFDVQFPDGLQRAFDTGDRAMVAPYRVKRDLHAR